MPNANKPQMPNSNKPPNVVHDGAVKPTHVPRPPVAPPKNQKPK